MRIFTRYILREVTSYALLGGVLFTFVLFMNHINEIVDLLVRGASFTDAARIIGDMLPNTLTVTIPTAVLAGILLGLSRLAADSEVTAMRACGIGAFSFVRIVSILSFTALGVGLVNALYFVPKGASDLLKLEDELKSSQASFEIQPRVFYEGFKNYILYVQDVPSSGGAASWRHVFLADLTQPANPNVITAEQASVSGSHGADQQGVLLHLLMAASTRSHPPTPISTTSLPSPPPINPSRPPPRTRPTSRAPTPASRRSRSANSGSAPTASISAAAPFPPPTPAPPASNSTPASLIPSPASSSCSSACPSASPPNAAARAPASS